MTGQDNLRLARDTFDAWNAHDPEQLAKLVDEKYVGESDTLPSPVNGPQAVREFMKVYITAFPDLHFDIDQMLVDGDFVTSRWTATGTHQGVLMGIPPTNRRAVVRGCSVAEFRARRCVHDWTYWDTGSLLRQLGVMPGTK